MTHFLPVFSVPLLNVYVSPMKPCSQVSSERAPPKKGI